MLTAPDTASGKTLQCPKCQSRVTVPATPGPDQPARARRVRDDARPKQPVIDDWEEVEDEPERPQPRVKRRRKKKSSPALKFVGGAIGVILVLIVPTARIAKVALRANNIRVREQERDEQEAAKAAAIQKAVVAAKAPDTQTTDWTRFDAPRGEFTMYFPPGSNKAGPKLEQMPGDFGRVRSETWRQSAGDRQYSVRLDVYKPDVKDLANPEYAAKMRKNDLIRERMMKDGRKAVKFFRNAASLNPTQQRFTANLAVGLGDNRAIEFCVYGSGDVTLEDPTVKEFFDRIVIAPEQSRDLEDDRR